MRRVTLTVSALVLNLVLAMPALAADVAPLTAKQLAFSIENMDTSVDPRKDFYTYASGTWLKTTERPERFSSIGPFDYMQMQVNAQMANALAKASEDAVKAEKGSTTQLVGDFYAAYMDTAHIDALGMAPIQPELDRIKAIANKQDLSRYLSRFLLITGDIHLLGIVPSADRVDNKKLSLFVVSGRDGMPYPLVFQSPDGTPQREAYRTYMRDGLVVAGYPKDRAAKMADTALAIETEMFAGRLTPTQAANPLNTYAPTAFADLQKLIPELDLTAMLDELGLQPADTLYQTETTFPPVLSQILRKHSLDEVKDYTAWSLIRNYMDVLPTTFDGPLTELNRAILGISSLPPRSENIVSKLTKEMGHPVSKVYVDNYFAEATREKAAEMMKRIKAVFVDRMKKNSWLTEPTKAEALRKVEKLSFAVGSPATWLDYSKVDIRRDDAFGNLLRLREYVGRRDIAKYGKPYARDGFANSRATLPIIINAAYDSQLNGFEVPAAIMQAPVFETALDAPVYYCKLGAIIGHEMTHGFDSSGRNFDAVGVMRDWWTPQDNSAFQKEANKLVEQANAFEILPGLKINGAQTVTENLADAGGLTLAYEALQQYLAEHPEENKVVDGFTPQQRCFIAYTQLWTVKATEQSVRQTVATDFHAPNQYRATAALMHVDGFYEAFGIKEGDPMWLAPDKRLRAW